LANQTITRYSEARLPTPHAEFHLVVYRTGGGPEEHVALVLGDVTGDGVLARLRCDCRAQLDAAMERIAREGRGVIVYLVQEGRGIGLGNKVRAYQLQDEGHDTVDANLALGFDADHRSYDLAAGILRDLGVGSVRLMTNNPQKIAGLEATGVVVDAQESHWVGATEHSQGYLDAKKSKLGHLT